MPTSSENRTVDARGAVRASIYLAAALYCDGAPVPVKIRNISTTGALVECGVVPAAGSLVQLVRGGLIVHALVTWSAEGKCGLKFSGCVDVQQWRASPANPEQQRVDEVVRLVKAGAVPLAVPPLGEAKSRNETADPAMQLSEDLRRVAQLLDNLGDELSTDLEAMSRHGAALQNLDIAKQVIIAVDAIIGGEGNFDTDSKKLEALRRSADQALQQR